MPLVSNGLKAGGAFAARWGVGGTAVRGRRTGTWARGMAGTEASRRTARAGSECFITAPTTNQAWWCQPGINNSQRPRTYPSEKAVTCQCREVNRQRLWWAEAGGGDEGEQRAPGCARPLRRSGALLLTPQCQSDSKVQASSSLPAVRL